jgi:dTDP-glucose 4,6-dehydratase
MVTNRKGIILAEDHGRGLLAAFEQGKDGEVYNFGASSERHNVQIVKRVLELVEKPPISGEYLEYYEKQYEGR